MKPLVLAALLLVFLTPFVRAEEKPLVRVQITYVDTPFDEIAIGQIYPFMTDIVGNVLKDFKHALDNVPEHYKVIRGPDVIVRNGSRVALDKMQLISSAWHGKKGAKWLYGPGMAVTPIGVQDNFVTLKIKMPDYNTPGTDGWLLGKHEIAEYPAYSVYKAHSGSTICLTINSNSTIVERFTFATVTILPPTKD